MQVTKREHACLILEKDGASLVVDPGDKAAPISVRGLAAIVLTHEHADHWDPARLRELTEAHPDAPIYAPEGVADAAEGFTIDVVSPGETRQAGPFALRFTGGSHAVIHESIPVVDNLGVMVDEALYYPGDSYALPDAPVALLATPAGAPWLKIGDVIDFVLAVAPEQTFATHVLTLSPWGLEMANARIRAAVEHGGGTHHVVDVGDVLEV